MQMGWKTQRAYFIDPYKVEFMELSGYLCHLKMWIAMINDNVRGCIQKFPDWVDKEIYAYNNKHSLGSNKNGYDGKTR